MDSLPTDGEVRAIAYEAKQLTRDELRKRFCRNQLKVHTMSFEGTKIESTVFVTIYAWDRGDEEWATLEQFAHDHGYCIEKGFYSNEDDDQ